MLLSVSLDRALICNKSNYFCWLFMKTDKEVLCWIFDSSGIHCGNTNILGDAIMRRIFMRELVLSVSIPFSGRLGMFGEWK